MSRDVVFAALASQGIAKAFVSFWGGGGEQWTETKFVDAQDAELGIVANSLLQERLEIPIDDSVDFDGQDLEGTLTWDVASREVSYTIRYKIWSDEETVDCPEVTRNPTPSSKDFE